jgi:SAM-dependent methyltransferase
MTRPDPDEQTHLLAAEAIAGGDPTAWFERLYAGAEAGELVVPWDRGAPHRLLVEWAREHAVAGRGRPAVVVGAGLGEDAEFVAGLGFDTVAFDVAATAAHSARQRFPDSPVAYRTANLLKLPDEWAHGFDLVFESLTVQSLPVELRRDAIVQVGRLVAPGGTLLVIAAVRGENAGPADGPPWPLTRTEIESFAAGGLDPVRIEDLQDPLNPTVHRWLAEFRRPVEQ